MNIKSAYDRIMELQRRLETVPDAVADIVRKEQQTILWLKRDTILLGLDKDSFPFTPRYTEDGHFKTPVAARRYYDWKQDMRSETRSLIRYLEDEPEKHPDTPDLYITGLWTYNPSTIRTGGDSFSIINPHPQGGRIWDKYNIGDGLNFVAREYFWGNFLCFKLQNHIWK